MLPHTVHMSVADVQSMTEITSELKKKKSMKFHRLTVCLRQCSVSATQHKLKKCRRVLSDLQVIVPNGFALAWLCPVTLPQR